MLRTYTLIALGLALALAAGCVGRGQGPAEIAGAGVVAPEVLAKASLKYYWQTPTLRLDRGETLERIWHLDENVYALTSSNRLIAVDAAMGKYKWSVPVAKPGVKVFSPCHADDVRLPDYGGIRVVLDPPDPGSIDPVKCVILNTASYALVLDRASGERLRKLSFKFAANSPGSSDSIHFFVGSAGGRYYAVRLTDALLAWTMGTDDMISARPAVHGGWLYVGSRDGRFYAVDPYLARNRRRWTEKTDGPLTADFFVDDRGCFVGGEDFNLYVYDRIDGGALWVFQAQGPLREPVQVGQRSVFQYADRDKFYALDLATGRKRWELPDGHFVAAAIPPHVYVLTLDRRLRVIHEALGQEKLALPMTGLDLFVRNAAKDTIYAATRGGKIVCIQAAWAGHLTPDMLKD